MILSIVFLISLPWGEGTVTFGNIVQINQDTLNTAQNHPEVIIDDSLRIFTCWQDDRDQNGNYEIYFSKSLDTGNNFSSDINISQSNNNDIFPRMVVLGQDIYVVWQAKIAGAWDIFYTYSHDAGDSFASPQSIPGITINNDLDSDINKGPRPHIGGFVENDSTFLYLVWEDDRTGVLRIRVARSIEENDFVDLGTVDNNAGHVNRQASIETNDRGHLLVSWAYGTSGTNQDPHPWIAFNKSTDRGETFYSADTILVDNTTEEVYRGTPSVSYADRDSTILVTWEDCRRQGGNEYPDIFFSRSSDGGHEFQKPNLKVNWISDTARLYNNYRAKVAMDPKGKLACAWHSDPDTNGNFSMYMCAYSDSVGKFGMSLPVKIDTLETFTGDTPGSFGNNFYPPGLKVADVGGITNFFMVWRDLNYDTNGNIYFVRGKVLVSQVDLDIYNHEYDVRDNIVDYDSLPAGPAYVSRYLKIACTSESINPDSVDGPSTTPIDSIYLSPFTLANSQGDKLETPFLEYSPDYLDIGEVDSVKLTLFIPEGKLKGDYTGFLSIAAVGSDSTLDTDSVEVIVRGPHPEKTLDSLQVFPNPYRPDMGHDKVNFEGLTANATVIIYDLKNRQVFREEEGSEEDGLITWEANVASGVYLYVVKNDEGELKKGKIAVIK